MGKYDRTWLGALHRIVGIMKKEMYQNILGTEFQRSAQMLFPDGNYLFQQENDPKHTARVVQNVIRQSGILLLDNWPAQSPDLIFFRHCTWLVYI